MIKVNQQMNTVMKGFDFAMNHFGISSEEVKVQIFVYENLAVLQKANPATGHTTSGKPIVIHNPAHQSLICSQANQCLSFSKRQQRLLDS